MERGPSSMLLGCTSSYSAGAVTPFQSPPGIPAGVPRGPSPPGFSCLASSCRRVKTVGVPHPLCPGSAGHVFAVALWLKVRMQVLTSSQDFIR